LLGEAHEREPPGVDKEGMPGGFAIFILMTKLPGKAITPSLLKDKTLEEREEIRAAFKKAIM
jgi:hypothetical protein